MFNDLKKAIRDVLNDAREDINEQNGLPYVDMVIDKKLLYILQSEYNIFFVEPGDLQFDPIQKP